MRMKFPREFYIPKGYQERKSPHEGSSAVAYVQLEPKPCAMGFSFNQAKPAFNYLYPSAERLEKHLAEFFDSVKASEAFKLEQAAKRKAEGPSDIAKRNGKIKSVLTQAFGKGVTVRGSRGTGYGWVHVNIPYAPRSIEEERKLQAKVWQLFDAAGIQIGTYGYDDPGSDYGYGRQISIRFEPVQDRGD